MQQFIYNLALLTVMAPLIGALIAGLFGKKIGPRGAHTVTIAGIALATAAAAYLCQLYIFDQAADLNAVIYTWAMGGSFNFNIGFLVDRLSVMMLLTVSSVSLLVHIYSIGYMQQDPGYQRFFSYMSLFTFFMLVLTLSNNFVSLFFGWEGVGLVSYLLIGFWFKKESAAQGSLKAFLVNRAGDFGFILAIAAILDYSKSLDYATVFSTAANLAQTSISIFGGHSTAITVICILLFIGAMGKSAQIPLHVWLPESMEGPTPISALIHAATMVTAGVYMVARLSPLFQYSPTALSVVLIIGATGALFMGLLGVVENDIKRVIAYSTMSQLGYMMAAEGAGAYAAGMFHLITHAYFKALLFLAAGSVIIALHHEQNLWKMGALRKALPITYITFLVGALSLCAIPPFAGYYSKDTIINAVHFSTVAGSEYAYICLLLATFVTGLYIFRAFFLTFHGKSRVEPTLQGNLKESRATMLIPLIVLAIPTFSIGMVLTRSTLKNILFGHSIIITPVAQTLAQQYQNLLQMTAEALKAAPVWFAIAGIFVAWLGYIKFPAWSVWTRKHFNLFYRILIDKYGFDAFNQFVFVRGVRHLSDFFFYVTDLKVIDNWFVNGSGRVIYKISYLLRRLQSGYLYHYALAMMVGLFIFLAWALFK